MLARVSVTFPWLLMSTLVPFNRVTINHTSGSCSAFAALLSRCAAKAVVPIVRVVARANSAPAWAALIPQVGDSA